jgi:nucleoid-associated protein YgaU
MIAMARGRHRKLKNTPGKRVVVAITAGTGVAFPLIVAGGSANAATQDQWEAIAQCESGNDWSINWSGDGQSVGGLQFQNASWKDALAYLERQGVDTSNWTQDLYQGMPRDKVPTKSQTILAGEALLALQGPGAWVCKGTGLGPSMFEGGQKPAILAEGAPASSESAPKPQQTAPSPEPTQKSGPAETGPTETGPTQKSGAMGTHTVRPGDTLYSITMARTGGASDSWQELYEANEDVVGANPDLIYPGQILELPWGESESSQ